MDIIKEKGRREMKCQTEDRCVIIRQRGLVCRFVVYTYYREGARLGGGDGWWLVGTGAEAA